MHSTVSQVSFDELNWNPLPNWNGGTWSVGFPKEVNASLLALIGLSLRLRDPFQTVPLPGNTQTPEEPVAMQDFRISSMYPPFVGVFPSRAWILTRTLFLLEKWLKFP